MGSFFALPQRLCPSISSHDGVGNSVVEWQGVVAVEGVCTFALLPDGGDNLSSHQIVRLGGEVARPGREHVPHVP
jgi:hypothetical protein